MANNNFNRSRGKNNSNPKVVQACKLPDNYVDEAEKIMQENVRNITTSKIRNILSQITDIYNYENLSHDQNLSDESVSKLQTARIRIVYESGRDRKVKNFIENSKILEYMKDIGRSRQKLIKFSHYLEALVAYHRFYGGRES